MEIKKTVGTEGLEGTRKDYVIHTACGEEFYAKATGSQGYECGGQSFKSVKDVKVAITEGMFSETGDNPATETSTAEGIDTWDCVHPCAWLCLVTTGCKETLETLDNYGWLNELGRPDITRAEREIARTRNIPQEVQTDE